MKKRSRRHRAGRRAGPSVAGPRNVPRTAPEVAVSAGERTLPDQPRGGARRALVLWPFLIGALLLGAIIYLVGHRKQKAAETVAAVPAGPTGAATNLSLKTAEPSPASPTNASPEHAAELLNHGTELYHQGQIEEALRFFQLAAQENPEDEDVYFNLGIAMAALGKP